MFPMVLYTYTQTTNTKLPKIITQALANTFYIRRNKRYFDCFHLSKIIDAADVDNIQIL